MNQWPGSRILPTRRGTGNRQITSLSQDGKKRCQRGQSRKKVAYYRGDKNSFYAVIYSPMLSFTWLQAVLLQCLALPTVLWGQPKEPLPYLTRRTQ